VARGLSNRESRHTLPVAKMTQSESTTVESETRPRKETMGRKPHQPRRLWAGDEGQGVKTKEAEMPPGEKDRDHKNHRHEPMNRRKLGAPKIKTPGQKDMDEKKKPQKKKDKNAKPTTSARTQWRTAARGRSRKNRGAGKQQKRRISVRRKAPHGGNSQDAHPFPEKDIKQVPLTGRGGDIREGLGKKGGPKLSRRGSKKKVE